MYLDQFKGKAFVEDLVDLCPPSELPLADDIGPAPSDSVLEINTKVLHQPAKKIKLVGGNYD